MGYSIFKEYLFHFGVYAMNMEWAKVKALFPFNEV